MREKNSMGKKPETNRNGGQGRKHVDPTRRAAPPVGKGKAPLTRNQVMLRARADYRHWAELDALEAADPHHRAPAPFATQRMEWQCQEAARRVGALHQVATGGGMATVDLLGSGGGGGGPPSSPQERIAWAIGQLRRVAVAIGPDRVRLDARGEGPAVVHLVAWVCCGDGRLRSFIRHQGLKPNGDRQRACEAALEAALARVAQVVGAQG